MTKPSLRVLPIEHSLVRIVRGGGTRNRINLGEIKPYLQSIDW